MNISPLNQQIKLAKEALQQGDRQTAGEISSQIVDQHPNCLDAWLILGGISQPEKRWYYLKQAQKIAPSDPHVRKALSWAKSLQVETNTHNTAINEESSLEKTQSIVAKNFIPKDAEKNKSIWIRYFLVILSIVVIGFCLVSLPLILENNNINISNFQISELIKPTLTNTVKMEAPESTTATLGTPINTTIPPIITTLSPTITKVPDLYGCDTEIIFNSGPLNGEETFFSMLDETYFLDKSDKFDIGKNTGVFYDEESYVILHSGYNDGNIMSPLEIEFLRKFLELWGDEEIDYIEGQINDLIGAEAIWRCDGQEIMKTRVNDVVRLSREASLRLWLEPTNIYEIVEAREGEPSEWIGDIDQIFPGTIYLGFCGWGPPEVTIDRSIYYRYLVQFELIE